MPRSVLSATVLYTEFWFSDEAAVLPGKRKTPRFLKRVKITGGNSGQERKENVMDSQE